MGQVFLLLGIHNHQPVGNFEHVFREAHDRCYRPFLDLLREHKAIRAAMHYSGPLFDWMEGNEPSFIGRLKEMVKDGQVELLTGGYYEPILASIPARDGIGQIGMMTQYLRNRLGADPKGLWLAERVWEPSLPGLLNSCGIGYSLLDDTHFQYAGVKPETLRGYYLTEHEGKVLAIFPISKRLRYLIPFRQPEETIEYLGQLRKEGPVAITYADDGEKFGLWPGTYRWVYDMGWIKRFFALLEENSGWITTITPGEYMAKSPPSGRIYLPTASYEEMMEWALPTETILAREALIAKLEALGLKGAAEGFLRGGLWNYFLVKYPEINLMHKKALYISEKLSLKEKKPGISMTKWFEEARRELYKAQGNDVYWHGLFGGYYLNYLRHAVHEHLIKAERLIDAKTDPRIRLTETDLDRDGYQEFIAETPCLNLYLKPDDGATVIEIDYRPKALCLTHVPMRRPEAYHKKIKIDQPAASSPSPGSIPSIHELTSLKPSVVGKRLIYDRCPRWSFRDHLLTQDITLDQFEASIHAELGGFSHNPYEKMEARTGTDGIVLAFQHTDMIGDLSLTAKKVYTVSASDAVFTVQYAFSNGPEQVQSPDQNGHGLLWGVELNLTLLAGSDPKRYYSFSGRDVEGKLLNSRGVLEDLTEAHLIDEWQGVDICLEFRPAARLWRFPIEMISQSEEGLESNYQGSCLVILWPLTLPLNGKQERLITMKISGQ